MVHVGSTVRRRGGGVSVLSEDVRSHATPVVFAKPAQTLGPISVSTAALCESCTDPRSHQRLYRCTRMHTRVPEVKRSASTRSRVEP
eukprot:2876402-Rhodomonas_salina.1